MTMRVGLTGGIGSGKSTVLAMLAKLGAATIAADAISRSATAAGGAAIAEIARVFGPAFVTPDGALHRDRMLERTFALPQALMQLESIIHPLVGAYIARQVEAALASRAGG